MVNYQNGKIYKLLLPDGYFYIGCTVNELKVRKQAHKNACNVKECENRKLYKHIRENGFLWKDIHIVLYEECPCEIKSELLLKESQIIRIFYKNEFCLNSQTNTNFDGSTQKQKKLRIKEYNVENAERIKDKAKEYYVENTERFKEYYVENAERIKDKNKEYYVENAERIKDKAKKNIVCECGVQTTINSIYRHKISKKHLKLLELN